jgi:ankyrin repeat protein
MPLIQRLLRRAAGSPRPEGEPGPLDSNMSLRSSLPESAFLDILSALSPLPDFPRLLTTANEHGQTLLHLAIHLRYRELVQKLVHWGIDPNVRDINGSTALHIGYLCDDPFVVGFVEAEGATPFVLDELGRSPSELAASVSSCNYSTTRRDEEMVPFPVGYINQPKEQCRSPDLAIPSETQETALGTAAEKGHSSEYVIFCHVHN